jgi:hypothetical protein
MNTLLLLLALKPCQDGRKVPMFLRMASNPVLAFQRAGDAVANDVVRAGAAVSHRLVPHL